MWVPVVYLTAGPKGVSGKWEGEGGEGNKLLAVNRYSLRSLVQSSWTTLGGGVEHNLRLSQLEGWGSWGINLPTLLVIDQAWWLHRLCQTGRFLRQKNCRCPTDRSFQEQQKVKRCEWSMNRVCYSPYFKGTEWALNVAMQLESLAMHST